MPFSAADVDLYLGARDLNAKLARLRARWTGWPLRTRLVPVERDLIVRTRLSRARVDHSKLPHLRRRARLAASVDNAT